MVVESGPLALVRKRQYTLAVDVALSWIVACWGFKSASNNHEKRSNSRGRSRNPGSSKGTPSKRSGGNQYPPPANIKTADLVNELREVVKCLCIDGLGHEATAIVNKCKEVGPNSIDWNLQLNLSMSIDAMMKRGRFELASRALEEFEIINVQRPDFNCLYNFLNALIAHKQYKLAMEWTGKLELWQTTNSTSLPPALVWTPVSVITAMATAGDFENALKYIEQYRLDQQFPVASLVDGLIAHKLFKAAMKYIKAFSLNEPRFQKKVLVDSMLSASDWVGAIETIASTKGLGDPEDLSIIYTKEEIINKMIMEKDWSAVSKYIAVFQIDRKNFAQQKVLIDFIHGLIAAGELQKAMTYSVNHDLEEFFSKEMLIQTMIDLGQYHHAVHYMKVYKLENTFKSQMPGIRASRISALRAHRRLMSHRHRAAKLRRQRAAGLEVDPLLAKSSKNIEVVQELRYQSDSHIVTRIPHDSDDACLKSGSSFLATSKKLLRNDSVVGNSGVSETEELGNTSEHKNLDDDDDEEILLLAQPKASEQIKQKPTESPMTSTTPNSHSPIRNDRVPQSASFHPGRVPPQGPPRMQFPALPQPRMLNSPQSMQTAHVPVRMADPRVNHMPHTMVPPRANIMSPSGMPGSPFSPPLFDNPRYRNNMYGSQVQRQYPPMNPNLKMNQPIQSGPPTTSSANKPSLLTPSQVVFKKKKSKAK